MEDKMAVSLLKQPITTEESTRDLDDPSRDRCESDEQLNVLTLNYEYPPLGGGAAPVSQDLAKKLVEDGHSVDVVTMGFGDLPRTQNDDGVSVYRVPGLRTEKSSCRVHEMFSYLPTAFWKARQLHHEVGYDVVHAHFLIPTGIVAYALHKTVELPYVVTAHGSDVPGHNPERFGVAHKLAKPVWSRIFSFAQHIVSPSEYLANRIEREVESGLLSPHRSRTTPIEVIPNGFAPDKIVPAENPEKRILIASRLYKLKGIHRFLDALERVDTDWDVVIAGDGPYRKELVRKASEMELGVAFPGWLSEDELNPLLRTSAIYVFPSSQENCPVALQEAMAAGCAVVASEEGGAAEVIADAGLRVDPEDTAAFAASLKRLLSDEALRAELQAAARRRIERVYSWDRIAIEYQSLFP